MAFCSGCGTPLDEGMKFCGGCGQAAYQPLRNTTTRKITIVPETSKVVSTEITPAMKRTAVIVIALSIAAILLVVLGLAVEKFAVSLLGVGLIVVGYVYNKAVRKKSGEGDQALAVAQKMLNELVSQQPLLMNYFGIPNADCILPVPDTMFGRKLASLLPDDFDKDSLSLHKYEGLHYTHAQVVKGNHTSVPSMQSGASGLFTDPREVLALRYERSALKKYIFRAIVNMEATLGIGGGENYQALIEKLNDFVVVSQNDNATIYLSDDDFIDLSLVRQELFRICNALHINYDDMGLGEYSAARSTWFAAGSGALVGFAITATAFSHLNAKIKESLFKDASVYVALNNVIRHFNEM